jgi:hypothetical protein
MSDKGILQIAELRQAARPYLQVVTTSIVALGLWGGWAETGWLIVTVIFVIMIASVIFIGRRVTL